jgi:hypothetical protein
MVAFHPMFLVVLVAVVVVFVVAVALVIWALSDHSGGPQGPH